MQGFNMGRYYPPDASNPPQFNTSSHPLGARASKLSQGILTVRFELPFAVWCTTCTPHMVVGQGVRFNAQKKKVGNYFSTPIWSFRMKHTACGGWWEIRTDPQNTAYVVVEGARKRDYGPEEQQHADGELKFLTEQEREARRSDAFKSFEGKVDDGVDKREKRERVEELYDKAEVWRDPYDVNARLRRDFREKRKAWRAEDREKEGVQEKFSLGIEIVDETEMDRRRAGLVEFGNGGGASDASNKAEGQVETTTSSSSSSSSSWKPLFAPETGKDKAIIDPPPTPSSAKKLKSAIAAEKSKRSLQSTLIGNTKAAIDPFLSRSSSLSSSKPSFSLLKRKRDADGADQVGKLPAPKIDAATEVDVEEAEKKQGTLSSMLVGYDSD